MQSCAACNVVALGSRTVNLSRAASIAGSGPRHMHAPPQMDRRSEWSYLLQRAEAQSALHGHMQGCSRLLYTGIA